jgi:hypothetical protein
MPGDAMMMGFPGGPAGFQFQNPAMLFAGLNGMMMPNQVCVSILFTCVVLCVVDVREDSCVRTRCVCMHVNDVG